MDDYIDSSVQVGEISIAVRDFGGSGPPVVLLHGGGRNLCDWYRTVPFLHPYHRVVALDLRSHGYSTPYEGRRQFEDDVNDLEAVIAHVGLDNPFVIGHSLGGLVATLYGARYPDCRGVVNLDGIGVSLPSTFPGPDPEGARQKLRALIEAMADPARPAEDLPPTYLHQADVEAKVATVRAQEGHDVSFAVSFTERSFFRYPDGRYQDNPSAIALAALSDAIVDFDIFAVTHQVRCPLLFIGAGEQSGEAPGGDEMAESMYLWRKGVQMEFESLSQNYPNIHWASVPGDHMFILHESVPHREPILHFTGGK
ncbi:hypothetical protein KDA_35900 [Dictyobacter alpinus]|uniref:AB hydrolase-1 domain-containing protein n=1 Tax=Dictyobacter alpinus TaxID=2014873 RepID=A0A402B9V3_9CHLR|nr:alpha/beta hydrolase [Dictyobacter alpinus]GCE28106.1 hypothetical protein KDA_35900 [Dictyobacter alpinus]